jgi:general L-amino acid transport system substrate-binding protein
MIKLWVSALAVGVVVALAASAQAGPTLDKVKQSGQISCGVQTGLAGFAAPDSRNYAGFNVDICKALSTAILVPRTSQICAADGAATLPRCSRASRPPVNNDDTLQRDTALGLNFAPVVFTTDRVLGTEEARVKSAKELNGATICVSPVQPRSSASPTTSVPIR